ncbi:FHA domain-containing protein [Cellulomonas sp. HZM]|uniref:FHA domain-containing protein n=1 Tax=Cellulomonas sp. HZM TaxID=1454010 RepID=UPI0012DCE5EB|nr:FHA domain-containing protein [Cellulomonas sp. HZM]
MTRRVVLASDPSTSASSGQRFAAVLVDLCALLVVAAPAVVGALSRSTVLLLSGILAVVVLACAQVVVRVRRGATIGQTACGLRRVPADERASFPARPASGVDGLRAPSRAGSSARLAPTPAEPAPVPPWAAGRAHADAPAVTGSQPLVLAPLAPRTHGPDVDTRALPIVPPRPAGSPGTPPPGPAATTPAPAASRPYADDLPGGAAPVLRAEPLPEPFPGPFPELDPDVEATRRAGEPPDSQVPAAPPRPDGAELALNDGRRVVVEQVALVGRNPAAAVDVQLVRVVDPGRSVSKTHLQVAVSPAGVWVADRGSTNGTVVTFPDGAQVVCPVDQPIRLRVGATVSFGDYTFVLVRAPQATA